MPIDTRAGRPSGRTWFVRSLVLVLLAATLALVLACAEPRWLLRSLPGDYPEVVYYVPTSAPAVALTIDDGLDPVTTPLILDTLRRHDARATFFILSDTIPGNEALLQRLIDEGHELGHHMTRDEVTVRLDDEALYAGFQAAADALESWAPIRWFRPGSGRYDDRVLALVRSRGYRIALASVPPLDTVLWDDGLMTANVLAMAEAGSVIVLHDRGERGRRTVNTLSRVLPELAERGLAALTLSELDTRAEKLEQHDPQ